MLTERANELARHCTEAVRNGKHFPTVWHSMLKGHALVEGIPRQRLDGPRPVLVIPLITGQLLVFDADAKEFRLQ
jgi:hypothetical protein